MPILIILGWLIIFGCLIYLATDVARNRFYDRRARKAAAKRIQYFKKHHYYDEERKKWVRKRDSVAYPDASDESQGNVIRFGYLMLVLWELFWVVEVATAPRLSQIPYLFLLVMMIGLPLALRALLRSILRFAPMA
jgi:hypothetical protein